MVMGEIPTRSGWRGARGFARLVQASTWILVAVWGSLIVLSSGLIGSEQPLAARLPDLLSTAAFVGLFLVGGGVVHAVLEATIAVFALAADGRSLPAIEKNVRMNLQLPALMAAPAAAVEPVPEPVAEREDLPVARPVEPMIVRRRPATA